MCYYNYPRMACLDFFPYLTSLTIVAQDIERIEGLDECRNLTHLWVCETKLQIISGLDRCQALRSLFLYVAYDAQYFLIFLDIAIESRKLVDWINWKDSSNSG
jgi:hypothetical protein